MQDLRNLYQEVVIDHSRKPRNFHKMEDPSHCSDGFNPLCGDKLTLYLKIDGDVISDASFDGHGCAISLASASLMTAYLKGKAIDQAKTMFHNFHSAVTQNDQEAESKLEKFSVLAGVKEFPARVKCATLAWHTFRSALEKSLEVASTE